MKIRFSAAIVALAFGAGFAATATAQVKPETLVKQRQSAMTLQGKYFFPLVPMLQGKVPYNASVAARNAVLLDALTQMAWDGFDASTQGEKSRALPEIYKNPAGFKAEVDKLRAGVSTLVAATKANNEAEAKAAMGEIFKSCNSCHDSYRSK